jgi:hypothetical protein
VAFLWRGNLFECERKNLLSAANHSCFSPSKWIYAVALILYPATPYKVLSNTPQAGTSFAILSNKNGEV